MRSAGDLVECLRGTAGAQARELAFAEVVQRFADMAFATAYAITGDFHLAEDAAQEAFVNAWRHLGDLREPAAFPGWFRRIVQTQAHLLRRRQRVPAPPEDASAGATEGPAARAERRDLQERVHRAISALPEAQRTAIALYYVGGHSVAEIAGFLGVPASTVKNRLHSARQRLREGELLVAEGELHDHRPSKDPAFAEAVHARLFPFRTDLTYYEDRAQGWVSVHQAALPSALRLIGDMHPRFAGLAEAEIRSAPFALDDARLLVARQHGFDTWASFTRHIAELADGKVAEPFLTAFRAIAAGDVPGLRACLAAYPRLPNARGTNGNSLLHLAAGCRSLECARALLERGADPNLGNAREATPLHQAAYGNQTELAEMLLGAGAAVDVSSYGDGGTPLVWALFWGNVAVAEVLGRRGVVPSNLRAAAGMGAVEVLASLVDAEGHLLPEAGAHRAFYRPHTGFPDWTPSSDRREILDEAFVYACKNGRVEAMAFLLQRGADIEGDPYRGTGLIWAAATGKAVAVQWLLDHGANANRQATFGGPTHGEGVTALHLACQSGHLEVVRLLIERGGDRHLRDALHGGDALGWAGHGGEAAAGVQAYLAALG